MAVDEGMLAMGSWVRLPVCALAMLLVAVMPLRASPPREIAKFTPAAGTIALTEGGAEIRLEPQLVLYAADDAQRIMVDVWQNPPENAHGVIGLVMPAGQSPFNQAWGAVVRYEQIGLVDDRDGGVIDAADLMRRLKASEADQNRRLLAQG